jgi:hypothetical protein
MHRLSEQERKATAYHEAGHVVVGIIFGRDPLSSTILPDGNGRLGKTEFDETPDFAKRGPNSWPDQQYRHYVQGRVVGQVAGTIAHDLNEPRRAHDAGDTNDENEARQLIEDQRVGRISRRRNPPSWCDVNGELPIANPPYALPNSIVGDEPHCTASAKGRLSPGVCGHRRERGYGLRSHRILFHHLRALKPRL